MPPTTSARPVDVQLGTVLRTMREAVPATIPEAAALLFTTTDVVRALEAGEIALLPPLAETRRLVSRYGELLGMDVGPALRRLERLMAPISEQPVVPRARPVVSHRPAPLPEAVPVPQAIRRSEPLPEVELPVGLIRRLGGSEPTERYSAAEPEPEAASTVQAWLARAKTVRRPLLFVALPAAGVLLAVVALSSSRTALNASLSLLPDGVSKSVRQQLGAPRVVVGPDGLKWVVVADPRWRKTDRLPVAKKP